MDNYTGDPNLDVQFDTAMTPNLPAPIPPGVYEQLIDHIETSSWAEIGLLAALIIYVGVMIGYFLAG